MEGVSENPSIQVVDAHAVAQNIVQGFQTVVSSIEERTE